MMATNSGGGSGGKGGNRKLYRDQMQKSGISEPGLKKGVPSTAIPVTKANPGLGMKTISHPFLKGKSKI